MAPSFDVFLSYSRSDEAYVRRIDAALREQQLRCFLDLWYLTPGQPWQERLEQHILQCRAVAVLLGPQDIGSWQHREYRLAIQRQVNEDKQGRPFPVIPVLLPGAKDASPGFLAHNMWVDFRDNAVWQDEIEILVRAINGQPRGAPGKMPSRDPRGTICPYRGLETFREEDAPFYFGREQQIREFAERIERDRFIAIVGPSGSGKSSLVYSGLFPLLRDPTRGATWELMSLRPGKEPLRPLARLVPFDAGLDGHRRKLEEKKRTADLVAGHISLADWADTVLEDQPGTDRLLLFVDQWEELYTEATSHVKSGKADDPGQVERFIDQVLDATARDKLTVVMTMRGDFFGTAVSYRPLADRLKHAVVPLGPLDEQELLDVIVSPAAKVGLTFEEGLVERIRSDLGSAPGRLPLLEFLLKRLWDQRSRHSNQLLHDAYQKMGGVDGAIAAHADATLEGLVKQNAALEEKTRRLVVRLVNPGEGREDTRARIAIPDTSKDADLAKIIRAFTDARLVVASRETRGANAGEAEKTPELRAASTYAPSVPETGRIEVAHEALIQNWGRLKTWIDQSREFLRTVQRVQVARQEWEKDKKNSDRLLPNGRPLEEAKELLNRDDQMIEDLREYIEASVVSVSAQRAAEEQRERQRQQAELDAVKAREDAANERAAASKERDAASRRLLWRTGIGLGAVIVLAAVAALQWFKADQQKAAAQSAAATAEVERGKAAAQRDAVLITQSRFLTSLSEQLIAGGRHDAGTAMVLALEGLPDEAVAPDGKKLSDRSYIPETELSLNLALAARLENRVISGNTDPVNSAAISPDGRRILTGSGDDMLTVSHDNTARLWDTATGKELARLEGHTKAIKSVAFSADGGRILTGSEDMTARLWDAVTGQELARLEDHAGAVLAVAFSPDGGRILTGSWAKTARLWDAATGTKLALLEGHAEGVSSVAFSADGQRIVTGSWDKTACLWDAATGKKLIRLEGHTGGVTSVAFSADSQHILTGSWDRTAKLWDAATGKELAQLAGHAGVVRSVAYSADGRRILTASEDKTARLWDAATGKELARLEGHTAEVLSVAFSPDGERILTGSRDKTARLWDAPKDAERVRLKGHTDSVLSAVFSPDRTRILTGSEDKTARLWDAATGKELARLEGHDGSVPSLAFSPDGTRILTGSWDNTARLWDATTSKELARLASHAGGVTSVAFSPDGRRMLTGSWDKTARLWDVATGRELARLENHTEAIKSVAFSADGGRILTGSEDKTARLWDAATGRQLARLEGHVGAVLGVAFSPDGRYLLTGSWDKTARLWDATTGKELARLEGHADSVTSVAFSPDGRRIATASEDKTARLWDAATGKEFARLQGHDRGVLSVTFSSDGQLILTGSRDKTGRVWTAPLHLSKLVDDAKNLVPRCLTQQQRKEFFIQAEPPRWCVTGPGHETERDLAKWQPKWPYQSQAWKDWLVAKDRGEMRPVPTD